MRRFLSHIIICCISLLLAKCKKAPVIPKATLKFESVESVEKNTEILKIHFSSNISLTQKNFETQYESIKLICYPLLNKDKITIDDIRSYQKYELLNISPFEEAKEINSYNSHMSLIKNHSNKNSSNFIKQTDSLDYLFNSFSDCIPCAISAVTMLDISKPYISETMCVDKNTFVKIFK